MPEVKPRCLDLFCGAGGATKGLQRAGFHVTGVDIKAQPRYCGDAFHKADALTFTLDGFDFIWASPPCQRYSSATPEDKRADHPDLVGAVRERLESQSAPFCIENVGRSPLRATLILTGDLFAMNTFRRRLFETSFFVMAPRHGKAFGPLSRPGSETIVGHPNGNSRRDTRGERPKRGNLAKWSDIMGINWMRGNELVQAVPPAYSEFIGKQVMEYLKSGA